MMMFEAPLVDALGRQIGWMGSILDITEPKRLLDRERGQTETMAHHARLGAWAWAWAWGWRSAA